MNYPHLPAVGRTDTSAAAAPSGPQARTLQKHALRILRRGPATADEVAVALNETVLAIRPRFSELAACRLIEATPERRKNASGRNAIVWKITNPVNTHITV